MTSITKALAIASTLVAMATSTAFAGPGIGPENEQQYIVSRHESLIPQSSGVQRSNAAPATLVSPSASASHQGDASAFTPHRNAAE
ncbi:hypothetical protein V5F77_22480 [Xanthobacter sp. DSM 24535]|uniref:hypothetical protein n=1 Tax=Roseixanthobacter psychrophilus TaxID=3119917 RepID=UPI003727F7BB